MKYRIVELNNGDIHVEVNHQHANALKDIWEYVMYFKTYAEAHEYLDVKLKNIRGSRIKQVIREEEV